MEDWPEDVPLIILSDDDDQIECDCCFGECDFSRMVQVENSIFEGSCGSRPPPCLSIMGCTRSFPWSEVKKCFTEDIWSKYEKRVAEFDIAKAQLSNIVHCFHCQHLWEVDPEMKILSCTNPTCLKETCIECKGPAHHPHPCPNAEQDAEDFLRIEIEESMTRAVIRTCDSCKAELVKIDGCNKVTCRCGQQICYVCRQKISGYGHFCQHVRTLQAVSGCCNQCSLCYLWSKEDENEVAKAAKSAAIGKLAEQNPNILKREIGPSDECESKKKVKIGSRKRAFKLRKGQ